MSSPHHEEHWGLIPYQEALARQECLLDQVFQCASPDTLVFCSHPPVVTKGKSTPPSDLGHWTGETVTVTRGGRATFHGPHQLLIYPIVNLAKEGRRILRFRDVHQFVILLGQAMEASLQSWGVPAYFRQGEDQDEQGQRRQWSGLWVENRKLASVGIGVRRWVTFHGVALNVHPDPQGFGSIRPCGFSSEIMLALSEVMDEVPSYETLCQTIGREIWQRID